MHHQKRGQISTEYLLLIGFIGFMVLGILSLGFFYTSTIRDKIKTNQVGAAAQKIIQTAETVHYAGAPSQQTIPIYLPDGVSSIQLINKEIVVNISTSSGQNSIGYTSKVSLRTEDGTNMINSLEGFRRILVKAQGNDVTLTAL